MRKLLALWVVIALAGCLVPTPTPAPTPTATIVSPLPTPTIISPLTTPLPQILATPTPVPLAQRSKISVMIGFRPQGLEIFLSIAHPTVIYSLNNSVWDEIEEHSPHTLLVRRVQNDKWNRLPDGMYNGLGTSHWEADARASARYEALTKRTLIPGHGMLNYVEIAALSEQDFLSPMNEPVLGDRGDFIEKAKWLDVWFQEWLSIAHAYGLHGCIYDFPTGEPAVAAVPYLANSARIAAANRDVICVHEYGVNGSLMSNDPENGALGFVRFHDALPPDARPMFVISEFSSGNGYDTALHGAAWISDSIAYGLALRRYPYLLGAAAFQLDLNAESNIPENVLEDYAIATTQIDWSLIYSMYLPIVANLN